MRDLKGAGRVLKEKYSEGDLKDLLLSHDDFHPFPKASEREPWDELPYSLRKQWIEIGERYVDITWPPLHATKFMDFKRTGNRSEFEKLHFNRRHILSSLVLAECIEGESRFIDQIINGIWTICEESFWGVPAHNIVSNNPGAPLPDVNEPIIDLFAAETAGLLAWIHYLLKPQLDKVTPLIVERIEFEIKRRILDPYLERNDFWWMGFTANRKVNNWNPWCNSNCLSAFLLIERDNARRVKAVKKALESLDKFIQIHHEDGGCDEGSSYWGRAGASLFDCLELLYWASGGKIAFYDEPLIKQIGRYIYRAHIHDDYFINFADGGAKVKISADLVYRYGKRIEDQKLIDMGLYAYNFQLQAQERTLKRSVPDSMLRQLPAIFNHKELVAKDTNPPYVRDIWLHGIQVMAAREREGDYRGFYLAAKGGHNAESHNHNDIGQFIVYYNGVPMIIDVGVETYTAKTFSRSRYDIWTMQSQYHNLPTINGIGQGSGEEYRAKDVEYKSGENLAQLSLDIAPSYPEEAGVKKWFRRCILYREGESHIKIRDEFELHHQTDDIMMSLMVPYISYIDNKKGTIYLIENDNNVIINFDKDIYVCESECIDIHDERLVSVWGNSIYRLIFKPYKPLHKGIWEITIIAG